jgi:hypothetical protein
MESNRDTLKMWVGLSSKLSSDFYHTARRHVAEDGVLHRIVACLPHAGAVETQKPRNKHATIEEQVFAARCWVTHARCMPKFWKTIIVRSMKPTLIHPLILPLLKSVLVIFFFHIPFVFPSIDIFVSNVCFYISLYAACPSCSYFSA